MSICLRLRALSQSGDRVLYQAACGEPASLSACVSASLSVCVSHEKINKILKKKNQFWKGTMPIHTDPYPRILKVVAHGLSSSQTCFVANLVFLKYLILFSAYKLGDLYMKNICISNFSLKD